MRYTPKQYATALFELAANKKDSEIDSLVNEFAQALKDNNDTQLVDGICKEFERLHERKRKQEQPVLAVAHREDAEVMVDKISALSRAQVKVDPSLMGGVRLRVGDKLLDNSIARRLKNLKKALGS